MVEGVEEEEEDPEEEDPEEEDPEEPEEDSADEDGFHDPPQNEADWQHLMEMQHLDAIDNGWESNEEEIVGEPGWMIWTAPDVIDIEVDSDDQTAAVLEPFRLLYLGSTELYKLRASFCNSSQSISKCSYCSIVAVTAAVMVPVFRSCFVATIYGSVTGDSYWSYPVQPKLHRLLWLHLFRSCCCSAVIESSPASCYSVETFYFETVAECFRGLYDDEDDEGGLHKVDPDCYRVVLYKSAWEEDLRD
ncbi:hypothetical protein RHMOL_Rhmol04G0216700 [Rhododendron molle]|uniref:Uncharacterized protein n=1 Tax=Rhododendron molle TaxID=49168 RepID=A0ACC0P2T1_RHOML|nr:hypothetical protein RHMOL_Rhmol04G0216700 [Rhododendron molle]